MGEVVHISRIAITRAKDGTRIATIEGLKDPVYYGMHGGIKSFYKAEPEVEHAATLDHIVGAVGGWMMGTLARVLAGYKIPTHTDRYEALVEGDIEDIDGVLRIPRIRVTYKLKVPKGKADEAREAFGRYITVCPAAMSVRGAIDITDSLEISELENR